MLSLSPEPTQTLPGRTYYSDSTLGPWRKPTGVYLPPGTDTDTGFVDMLIYLHGHLVPSIDQLFNLDGVAVRRQVLASGKNVVLAAPWLGLGGSGTTYKTSDITGAWGDTLINNVLNALVPPAIPKPDLYNIRPCSAPAPPKSGHSLSLRRRSRACAISSGRSDAISGI